MYVQPVHLEAVVTLKHLLETQYSTLNRDTYFNTIRKSTAVVMMTKLEKSTAMAFTDGRESERLNHS